MSGESVRLRLDIHHLDDGKADPDEDDEHDELLHGNLLRCGYCP